VCSKDELGAYPPMPRSLATGDLSKDLDCAFKANEWPEGSFDVCAVCRAHARR
jgi:hypothetical protein